MKKIAIKLFNPLLGLFVPLLSSHSLIDGAHQIAKTALIIARHICVTIHFSQPESQSSNRLSSFTAVIRCGDTE